MFRTLLFLIIFLNSAILSAQLKTYSRTNIFYGIVSTLLLGSSKLAERNIKPLSLPQIQQIQTQKLPSWELGANSNFRRSVPLALLL
jgi:hypothetical protein